MTETRIDKILNQFIPPDFGGGDLTVYDVRSAHGVAFSPANFTAIQGMHPQVRPIFYEVMDSVDKIASSAMTMNSMKMGADILAGHSFVLPTYFLIS